MVHAPVSLTEILYGSIKGSIMSGGRTPWSDYEGRVSRGRLKIPEGGCNAGEPYYPLLIPVGT